MGSPLLCAIQETKMSDTNVIPLKSDKGNIYNLYTSHCDNKYHGVGFVVSDRLNVKFNPVNNRLCYLILKSDEETTYVINAYAPTLPNSEKNPLVRDNFYDELQSVLELCKQKDIIFI